MGFLDDFQMFPNLNKEREDRAKAKEEAARKEAEKMAKAKEEQRRKERLEALAALCEEADPTPGKGAGSNKKAGTAEPPRLNRGSGLSNRNYLDNNAQPEPTYGMPGGPTLRRV